MSHIIGKTYDLTQESMNKLIRELEQCQAERDRMREALEYYRDYIPPHKVITPESAAYEREYGHGRKAREALEVNYVE
jgi:hypothetical protein